MPFTYQDVLEKFGLSNENDPCREIFSYKTNIEIFTPEKAIELFPELASVQNENVIYAPVRMCHSLPSINKRRRCFTRKTLKNSESLVGDNLVNFEHEISDNGFSKAERICGHLRGSRLLEPDNINSPATLIALSVLYARHPDIKKMAKEHINKTNWYVSMECAHDLSESHLYYDGGFIPFKEAPSNMLKCIGCEEIANYKGKELALVVGGEDGIANFWGMALTRSPADEDGNILSMFTASGQRSKKIVKEAANISFPIKLEFSKQNGNNSESINDNIVHEMSNIKVIGKTSENDGHSHEVLSDGTILPQNGHSHYIQYYIIETGSKPAFSAKIGEHVEGTTIDSGYGPKYESKVHTHLLEIDLKAKKNNDVKETGSNNIKGENEMGKKLELAIEQLTNASKAITELASKDGSSNLKEKLDLFSGINFQKVIASAVEEAIEEKIESGEILNKEDAEKKVSEAVKAKEDEITEKINFEKKIEEMKESRINAVKEAGIDIDFQIDKETKIIDIINNIPYTDDGTKIFTSNVSIWKALIATKGNTGVTEPTVAKGVAKEAASKPKSPLLAVGGGQVDTEHGKKSSKLPIGKNRVSVV